MEKELYDPQALRKLIDPHGVEIEEIKNELRAMGVLIKRLAERLNELENNRSLASD